jgi:cytochrome c oxidase assembly factor CtaG
MTRREAKAVELINAVLVKNGNSPITYEHIMLGSDETPVILNFILEAMEWQAQECAKAKDPTFQTWYADSVDLYSHDAWDEEDILNAGTEDV